VPLDSKVRKVLVKLADGMFPLQAWVDGKQKPPKPDKLPWRNGKTLNVEGTGAIKFFELLLETGVEEEEHRLERWEKLENDPLGGCPEALKTEMPAFRAARGLDPKSQFGVLESENVYTDVDDHPVLRLHFYEAYWPLLLEVDEAQTAKADWVKLAEELLKDNCASWPVGQPLRSSTFVFQLGRDLLHAMMNMQNSADSDDWKHALLIELGEHRRVGNEWTRSDSADAIKGLENALIAARGKPKPEPEPPQTLRAIRDDVATIGQPPKETYKGRRSRPQEAS
jgi:hypothetical protein